jgi:hypothetical protein
VSYWRTATGCSARSMTLRTCSRKPSYAPCERSIRTGCQWALRGAHAAGVHRDRVGHQPYDGLPGREPVGLVRHAAGTSVSRSTGWRQRTPHAGPARGGLQRAAGITMAGSPMPPDRARRFFGTAGRRRYTAQPPAQPGQWCGPELRSNPDHTGSFRGSEAPNLYHGSRSFSRGQGQATAGSSHDATVLSRLRRSADRRCHQRAYSLSWQ